MEKSCNLIKTGSDFCGVGAFDQALERLEIKQDKKFACDWDKFARQTYILNYGEPKYFPKDVYEREIPKESLDVYMTSPPCQAFSLAGKRDGEGDDRGVLFYNSHEFIKKNKPRYFIFENVKGLLSDDNGRTFGKWKEYLGGKSINGTATMFPHPDSVPYHIYYFVLNARKQGIPQNRERVFVVGIRDDDDNSFRIPKNIPLIKKLKDCLEEKVDEKYNLSQKILDYFVKNTSDQNKNGNGFRFEPKTKKSKYANSITTRAGGRMDDNYILVNSNTKKGFEKFTENDTFNFSQHTSKTRRGRVGKGVAQTLDTQCNQAVYQYGDVRKLTPRECFNFQDFPSSFKIEVSDAQAYKQAGNSIPVGLLVNIIKQFNFG